MSAITMCATNVKILTYYKLGDSVVPFLENSLNEKLFDDAKVVITREKRSIGPYQFLVDVIKINDGTPIECELIGVRKDNGVLVLRICQDWG